MSTHYITVGRSIELSEVMKLTDKFEDFKVEIERGDVGEGSDYLEPITTSSVLEGNKRYRISYTSKPTQLEIKFLQMEDVPTTNYLWIYVSENLYCEFVRYGGNDVDKIIQLIEFQTSLKLFDEHTFMEMEDKFGLFEDEEVEV